MKLSFKIDFSNQTRFDSVFSFAQRDDAPIRPWNAYLEEEESDREPRVLESQSQDQEMHCIPPAQRSPFRENPIEGIEKICQHSREVQKPSKPGYLSRVPNWHQEA